jgi:dipeptidyl aminopeptidase/acylaminoacyl peptidase
MNQQAAHRQTASISLAVMMLIMPTDIASLGTDASKNRRVERATVQAALQRAWSADIHADSLSATSDGRIIVFAGGGRALVLDARTASEIATIDDAEAPKISPGGAEIAFWSKRSGTRQMWLLRLNDNTYTQATHFAGGARPPSAFHGLWPSDAVRIAWSPDSQFIAFAHTELEKPQDGDRLKRPWLEQGAEVPVVTFSGEDFYPDPLYTVTPAKGPNQWTGAAASLYDLRAERSHVYVVNVSSLKLTQLTGGTVSYAGPDWAPDGTHIICVARDTTRGLSIQLEPALSVIDLPSGRVKNVTARGMRLLVGPTYSPDGLHIVYGASERQYGILRLFVANPRAGTIKPLPSDLAVLPDAFAWSSSHSIRMAVRKGTNSMIRSVDIERNEITAELTLEAAVTALAFSTSGEEITIRDDPTSPIHLVVTTENGKDRTIFIQHTDLREEDRPVYRPLMWKNSNGEVLDAMLLLPRIESTGAPPPVIVNMYPATASWRYQANPYYGTSLLLSQGFAVLKINFRGPHVLAAYTRSENFNLRARGPDGIDIMIEDIEGAIRELRRSGLVDTNRLCAYGHSNGGNALAHFITRSTELNCAVIHSPVLLDWQNSYLESPNAAWVAAQLDGATPMSAPELYARLSVFKSLDKVKTPTLLVTGELDRGVANSVKAMFIGLKTASKDVDLIVYPSETHVLSNDALSDLWYRILIYFNDHVPTPRKTPTAHTADTPHLYVLTPKGYQPAPRRVEPPLHRGVDKFVATIPPLMSDSAVVYLNDQV